MIRKILNLCFALILLSGSAACSTHQVSPNAQTPIASDNIAGIVAGYRAEIPQRMQQDKIPGMAIAVVDDKDVLWVEGFGYTDWSRRTPVTPSTLFSVQPITKSFTATAVMLAALCSLRAGLLIRLALLACARSFAIIPAEKDAGRRD